MNYLYRLLFVTFLIASGFTTAQTAIQLFNGKNLDGWYAYEAGSGKHTNASDVFTVEGHVIRLYGDKPGYLMSEQSFHNFKLTVEFRWNIDTTFVRVKESKNSGVMYLVPKETADTLWPKGIQFQIKEGFTGDFIFLKGVTLKINGKRTEPGKSVVIKRLEDAAKPVGKWNTMMVTYSNGKIKQELNGKVVNEGSEPSVSEGRILLMFEGYPIDFCKVEIEKL